MYYRDSLSRKGGRGWLSNNLTALLCRLGLLYVVWFLCRVLFYLQNSQALGAIGWSEVPDLMRGAWVFDSVSILYMNLLFIVCSLLPFRFRERRGYQKFLFWLFITVNTAGLIVNLADGVYFHYARKRFTSDELSYLSNNDNTGTVVLKALAENWYVVLVAVALVAFLVWGYRKFRIAPSRIRHPWVYFGLHFLVLTISVILVLGGIRGGLNRSTRPITLSNATQYTTSHLKANLILSNPFCMLRTLGNQSLTYTKYFDQETLERLYTPYHYPDSVAMDADSVARPRNVVIFFMESFSAEHSALLNPDLYGGQPGYTPFLDSLMREGYYFTNAFSNGRKSIDAMPSVLSSIPSYRTPFVLLPQALSRMESLPWILASQGYATSFFNGSARGSMGFGAYASLAGIEEYVAREDYEKERGTQDFDGYWGIWDEPFLNFMGERINRMKEPFFTSVFTLTSHHPFVVPKQYEEVLPAGKTKVHKGVAYTDQAVRRFMHEASKQPWYANTVFVFVGDHVSSETFAPKTQTPTGNSQVICFLYTPDGSLRGVDSTVSQQIDLMPTLLGVNGYRKPYFAFGRDVRHESDSLAMAVNFMGGNFQAITDSLVLFFDGERSVAAYRRSDTLQKNNILLEKLPEVDQVELHLKARLQQYYQHVEKGNYIVP